MIEGLSSSSTLSSDDANSWDAEQLVQWIKSEFWIPEQLGKTNPPSLPLFPYQEAVLREAHRRDADGHFVYDLVLWSDIKKSAKSTIAAAVTLFRALLTPWGSFKIVANDLEQANSRVFYYIQRAIGLNPKIRDLAHERGNRITFRNHAVIQAVPIDPTGEAGSNDDFIEFTELHGAKSKAQVAMWSEMTIPPNKHGFAQRWIDTYAGFSGEAPILEPLYHQTVETGEKLVLPKCPKDLPVFRNKRIFALWNTRPRLPWQTAEYYATEADILPENQFNRIHRNQWGSSSEAFIAIEWWDACRVPALPPMDRYAEIVIALDAAVSGDCFGLIAMFRLGDKVVPFYIRKWVPPAGGKLIYTNVEDVADRDYPEGEVRWLCAHYNVIVVGYDEYQLHHFCSQLQEQNVAYFRAFSQQGNRLKADNQLRIVIKQRRILNDGNPDLREHLQNANAQIVGDKLRIVKRAEHLKIDLAVATSMATDLAYEFLSE